MAYIQDNEKTIDMADDKILEAQKAFYEAILEVRKELAQDARDMRNELIQAFNRAHDENKDRMDAMVKALAEHSEKDDRRFALADKAIGVANRAIFMSAGGLAIVLIGIQIYNVFFKE
jgi:hypothetical protein